MKRNERDWAGQIISWIHEAINEGRTIFQDATNDSSIKLLSGRTKFPDVLLFSNKISGIIFNGWELKFPETAIDDRILLNNALEKAERIKSNSFVTWNGSEAIIWKIENEIYKLSSLSKIKIYPKEPTINCRDDLSDPIKYRRNESLLKERLNNILHDLGQFFLLGKLKKALNISDNFIKAIKEASDIIIPQFKNEIEKLKGVNVIFRRDFNNWKIYENSTLRMLSSSSIKPVNLMEEEVLAKFTYYNLIGKIIFYLTLSENLSGSLKKLEINSPKKIKNFLDNHFKNAQNIDYQAVFKPYFTDKIFFNTIVNETLFEMFKAITKLDFKVLPSEVIGTILENLVPKDEKKKFGQYFTSTILANLVSFPVIQTNHDFVFDPTSGTGTFLNSFYHILKYYGNNKHECLLNQIWGNDISHFPAILSVINLYKQNLNNIDNFPRIIRDDFFNLIPNSKIKFPDSKDYKNQVEQQIPYFDAISSNFPFIQQEDIPNGLMNKLFRKYFQLTQKAFLNKNTFSINERSDYFTYCVYNSTRFLKMNGYMSFITSNAWLGKEYGFQFKKFLLDNFHIKYIFKSNSEHWFSDSKVSTLFSVLHKVNKNESTKFISLNFKLNEFFDIENNTNQIKQIEDLYSDIDCCTHEHNKNWRKDDTFDNLYHRLDGLVDVSIVTKKSLEESIPNKINWNTFFISPDVFKIFDKHLIQPYPNIIDSFRGERTGWNKMFVVSSTDKKNSGIENQFFIPYIKSPTELNSITLEYYNNFYLFVCNKSTEELKKKYPGAIEWINRFKNTKNRNGTLTIQEACNGHKPYWYSLKPRKANIVTAINPYERFFFSYSENEFTIDQRLVAITVDKNYDVEIITALLNSIVTFLNIELRGTARNLGVLDLNANYFKTLKILNPNLLSEKSKIEIKNAFEPLKSRKIKTIFEEVKQKDRINFDKTVLNVYKIDGNILENLYHLLTTAVFERVNMKNN
jgi:hypothetical protein